MTVKSAPYYRLLASISVLGGEEEGEDWWEERVRGLAGDVGGLST